MSVRRSPILWLALAIIAAVLLIVATTGCRGDRDYVVPCDLEPGQLACWIEHTGPSVELADVYGVVRSDDFPIASDGIRVLQAVHVHGCIEVNHNAVLIIDVLVTMTEVCHGGDGQMIGSGINNGKNLSGLVLGDVEVYGNHASGMNPTNDFAGIAGRFDCVRCHSHGSTKSFAPIDGSVIEDSVGHDIYSATSTTHGEVVYANTTHGVTIRHSYLVADSSVPGMASTGAVMFGDTWGPSTGFTITDSYLQGVDGADISLGPNSVETGATITGNALSNHNGWGGTTTVNYWSCHPTNVWSGNYVPETGQPFAEPCP